MPTYSEDTITTALTAYCNGEYSSLRKCAYAFNIPRTTLSRQLSNRTSYVKSHESQQILSAAEEKTLFEAIIRLSKSGCPITLLLTRDLAEEIRLSRFRLSSTPTSYPPISKRWIDRFRKRHCSGAQSPRCSFLLAAAMWKPQERDRTPLSLNYSGRTPDQRERRDDGNYKPIFRNPVKADCE